MNSVGHARHYLSGLLGTQRRKNIEVIGEDVSGSTYQGMKQFISSSPWDHRKLMDQVARDANALLGDYEQAGLYIDESSFLKKGKASVGVQRQWSGRAGKVDNCQVGVFACLGQGERVCLTDYRLYLPKDWTKDESRLQRAGVPEDCRDYQSKHDQALDMIIHAKEQGLRFGWVGFDSLYGSKRELVNAVEDEGLKFVGDVNKTTKVWLNKPDLLAPEDNPISRRGGRPVKNYRLTKNNTARYETVEKLRFEYFEEDSRKVKYRQGTKGELWTRIWVKEVWTWEPSIEDARKRLLIVRGNSDGSFKYSLSNLSGGRDWAYYGWTQGQRFWIEHAFHEAKSQLGMAQYQVRVWRGWHHHMAMVSMALLFTQKLQLKLAGNAPLLSVRDITELLDYYLPRKRIDEAEVLKTIYDRNKRRRLDLDRRIERINGL